MFGRDSGEGEPAPSGDLANPEVQGGSLRTVCVRTCDGYYFPISYATNASRFAQDEKACQRLCPAAEVMLFSYPTQGADITQATSTSGQPYTALPNALKYRTEFNPSCSCKRPGQSWADALGKDEAVEPGDVVVTEERAKQLALPPPAQKGQTKGKQPAGTQPAATPAATTPPPAAAESEPGKRTVRSVGPTFIPPRILTPLILEKAGIGTRKAGSPLSRDDGFESKVERFAFRPCERAHRFVGLRQRRAGIAEAVDDRIAPVAAEILQRHLHARRRLPALVFGEIEHAVDAAAPCRGRSPPRRCRRRLLALDQPLKDRIEHLIGRQRILVLLVLAQLRGRRLGDDVLWDHVAVGPERAGRLPCVAQARQPEHLASCRGP